VRTLGDVTCASDGGFKALWVTAQCPLLAQSGHAASRTECPLLGAKPTSTSTICEREFSLSRLIPSYRDLPSTPSSFNILPIFVVYFPVKFARLEDTMRHLSWLFAIAVAVLVIQGGKNTDSAGAVSTDTMRISMMHRHADQNMPVMVIDNPF
jgi:hypothetical protein